MESGRSRSGAGVAFGVAAYLLWGVLPLYFTLLEPAGPIEIVAWRVVLSLVFCAILITVVRGWRRFSVMIRDRRTMAWLALASILVAINWLVFVFAVMSGHVVEGSLGYFINPIVTVLLGVLVLRERLRPLQWAAIAVSAVAVLVLAIGYGSVPWIALILAGSFGAYGLAKNRVGPTADAIGGLAAETAFLAPIAGAALLIMGFTGSLAMGTGVPLPTVPLLAAGVVTAVPLLLFAAAARRAPLSTVGMLQYMAPILQLLIGVFLLHEPMPPERWAGFAIVWLALILLTIDTLLHGARRRRARRLDPTDGIGAVV